MNIKSNGTRLRSRERMPNSAYMRAIASKKRLGRRRVAVRRAFIVADGQPITISAVLPRAFPRLRKYLHWHRWSCRRALLQDAEVIARNRFGRGRPALWAKRD